MTVRNIIALFVSVALGVVAGVLDCCLGGWLIIGLLLLSYIPNAMIVTLIAPRWSVLFGATINSVTLLSVLEAWSRTYPHHTAAEAQATVAAFGGYQALLIIWLGGIGIALAVGWIASGILRRRSRITEAEDQ